MRYKITLSYNGSGFNGWQTQKNGVGIQDVIEQKMKVFLQEKVNITGSGRTDAGVHAKMQVFHFDTEKELDNDFIYKINVFLPSGIAFRSIERVDNNFHARFSAKLRSYEYHISTIKDPFKEGYAYFYYRQLDVDLMNKGVAMLIGEHDFTSFSKVHTQVDHFRCILTHASWKRENNSLIFHVRANRFLRGMVRSLVGTSIWIGSGKLDTTAFKEIMKAKDRKSAGPSVPPKGLYLSHIEY